MEVLYKLLTLAVKSLLLALVQVERSERYREHRVTAKLEEARRQAPKPRQGLSHPMLQWGETLAIPGTPEEALIRQGIAAGEDTTPEGFVRLVFAGRVSGLMRALSLTTSESPKEHFKRCHGMIRGLRDAVQARCVPGTLKGFLEYLYSTSNWKKFDAHRTASRKRSLEYRKAHKEHAALMRARERWEKGLDDQMLKEALGRKRRLVMEDVLKLFPPVDDQDERSFRTTLGSALKRLGWVQHRGTDGSRFYTRH